MNTTRIQDLVDVSLNCPRCGSSNFQCPSELNPDTLLTCEGCGVATRFDHLIGTGDVGRILEACRKCAIEQAKKGLKF